MDAINPKHYQSFSNGAEAIDILENLVSNCANTAKYAIRSGRLDGDNKTDTLSGRLQDMKKARWYAIREVARLEKLIAEEKKANESKPEKTWQDWDKGTIIHPTEGEFTFTIHDMDIETVSKYFGFDSLSSNETDTEEPESKKTAFRAALPYLYEESAEYKWVTTEEESFVEADLTVRMELEDYRNFRSLDERLSHPAYQDYRWILSCEKK